MTIDDVMEYESFTPRDREAVQQEPPKDNVDYSAFPELGIKLHSVWFRNHGAHGPWYFDDSRSGRFNLSDPNGTLYVASSERGAIGERIGPDINEERGIHDSLLRDRWVSKLRLPFALRAADLTSGDALRFGVNASLGTMSQYDIPQKWAERFFKDEYGGIYTALKYTPATQAIGLAAFGLAGAKTWAAPKKKTSAISVAQKMGYRIWKNPSIRHMTMI